MRNRSDARAAVALLSLCVAFPAAAATPAAWLGGSGNWSNAAQWSTNPLFACNGNGGQSFDVSIAGGSPALDLACSIESLTLSGGSIAGSFDLTVNQAMAWTNGALNGSGQVVAAGGAALTGSAPKSFNGSGGLTLAGPSQWNEGILLLGSNGAVLRNQSSFDVSGAGNSLLDFNKTSSFVNEGTLNVALATPAAILTLAPGSCPNSGAVHVNTGILALTCNGTHSGSFGGPGTLRFSGTGAHVLAAGGSMSGAVLEMSGSTLTVQPGASFQIGHLITSGGTLTLNVPAVIPNATLGNSGAISGSGTLEFTGVTSLRGSMSGSGTTRLPNGGTLSILLGGTRTLVLEGGTSTITGNVSLGNSDATFRNESGSLLQATGASSRNISSSNGSGTMVNEGTLTIDLGTSSDPRQLTLSAGTSILGGEIHLERGILAVSRNASYSGSIDGAGTLRMRQPGSHTFASSANVTGVDVEIDGVAVTVAAGASFDVDSLTLVDNTSTSLGGNGLVEVAGPLSWAAGTMLGNGTTRVHGGAVLSGTNAKSLSGARVLALAGGISIWSGGNLSLGTGGASLHTEAAATLQVTGPSRQLNPFFSNGAVVNDGTLTLALDTPASELLMTSGAIQNRGTLELATGVLRLGGGAFTQTTGTTRLASGTLLRTNTGAQLQFVGGTLEGTGTVGADVTSAAVIAPGFSAGTLTVERHLTMLPGGELQPELGGLVPGFDHDFLSIGGNAALAGTLAPSFIAGFESSVVPGNVFLVLQAATPLTGAFANAASGQRVLVAPDYDSLAVSYGAGSPFGANRVMLHDFQAFAANDSIQVFGSAQGGSITLVVNGVSIVVHTTPGQTAAEVAEAIAAAIRAALGLTTQGIAGVASGPVVETNGDFEGPAQVTDPGITLDGIASVPALPLFGVGLLAAALAATGVRRARRHGCW